MAEPQLLTETAPARGGGLAAALADRARRVPVLEDLREGFAMHPVWRAFAWDEIQARYRRSRLGLAWIAITYVAFVLSIAVFFGGFTTRAGSGFVWYVAVGYAVFMFVNASLTDGCAVFKSSGSWIKSTDIPYSVYVYKSIARGLFVLGVNAACALLVLVFTGWTPSLWALAGLAALPVLVLNALWIQYAFGLIAARYRDVDHLVATVTRLLFFTTPILWVLEERGGVVRRLANLNPVTHYIEVVRAPILGEAPDAGSWWFVIALTALGWAATIALGTRMRRNLPFWV